MNDQDLINRWNAAYKAANLRELRKQNAALLEENRKLKVRLNAWPGRAAEHARQCVARERARLTGGAK